MPKIDWDKVEEAGHDFTHISYLLGRSSYLCENCGSFLIVKGIDDVALFHAPPSGEATLDKCIMVDQRIKNRKGTFKSKMEALNEADVERLKEI